MTSSTTADAAFTLAYPARWWSFTTNVRFLTESLCGHVCGDGEFSGRVGMAAHELLENAVKYSASPDHAVRLELEIAGDTLRVLVKNHGIEEHVASLRQEMAAAEGRAPLDLYIERMQADLPYTHSRLGLARIRYEGEARLNLGVNGLDVIMEAVFEIPQGEPGS